MEQSCLQNGELESSIERLRQDKGGLKERLRDERAQHAEDLLGFQRDLQLLLHQVEGLQAEKLAIQVRVPSRHCPSGMISLCVPPPPQTKHEASLKELRDENASLQAQLRRS